MTEEEAIRETKSQSTKKKNTYRRIASWKQKMGKMVNVKCHEFDED